MIQYTHYCCSDAAHEGQTGAGRRCEIVGPQVCVKILATLRKLYVGHNAVRPAFDVHIVRKGPCSQYSIGLSRRESILF